VDLIVTCLDHPAAVNQTFPLSDDEDLSTSDLLRRMCVALDRPVRLLPIPPSVIRLAMKLVGKEEMALRLLGDLQVDFSKTKRLLGWRPSVSVDQGLKKTAEWYLQLR
jgi:UDP-glucose 4-epimerase